MDSANKQKAHMATCQNTFPQSNGSQTAATWNPWTILCMVEAGEQSIPRQDRQCWTTGSESQEMLGGITPTPSQQGDWCLNQLWAGLAVIL